MAPSFLSLLLLLLSTQEPTDALGGATTNGFVLQQEINAALAAGPPPRFELPPGDVTFARGERLVVARAANMRLVAHPLGTTLWFQPGGGLKLVQCANVTVEGNLTIDYNPLPYVQAEILGMGPAEPAAAAAATTTDAGASRAMPPATLAPCAATGGGGGARPRPPCPHGWWSPSKNVCDQGCPSGAQGRNPTSGRCLCGSSAPNDKCLPGFSCVAGQCTNGGGGSHGGSSGQKWALDVPFKGFLSNVGTGSATKPQLCLNVDDCKDELILDGCPTSESATILTCAGIGNFSIFEFVLQYADGNASHQQLRSVYGDCVAAVAGADPCAGCSGDPCTRIANGTQRPCPQPTCSSSNLCKHATAPTLQRRPCDTRSNAQIWTHTALGQLRNGDPKNGADGLCLTANEAPAPPPAPPPEPSVRYTLRLAPRSPLFNFSCAKPKPGQSSPWQNNASVCQHDGINQLFGADRTPKIGSDFGGCPPLPASMCPMPRVPSVGSFEPAAGATDGRTFTAVMPAMLGSNGSSIAQVGDFLTYSGRDWYTLVIANSSNVTTSGLTIHSSSGFTIVELDGECGHTYQNVNVVRRDGYMIASNGDVFHSSDCAKGATIEDSTFEASLDDFYNVHTTVHVGWTLPTGGFYIVQPRETGTSESVGPEVSEDW